MRKEQSLIRAKTSGSTLGEVLLKEGLSSLIHGASLAYEVSKIGVRHGRAYFTDRAEQRLYAFHMRLIQGESTNEDEVVDILEKPFDLDEYHALLDACVHDIENEKADIYSDLMKALLLSEITKEHRRFFITITKQLTYAELSFLRKVYINQHFDMMTVGGVPSQIASILNPKDTMTAITIRKLISYGLVADDKKGLTDLGNSYVTALFKHDELTPQSIKKPAFTGLNIAIISYKIGDEHHDRVADYLQDALWHHNIKAGIFALQGQKSLTLPHVFFNAGVLILADTEYDEQHFDKNALIEFAKIRPLVRLNIAPNEIEIPNLKLEGSVDLNETDPQRLRQEIYELVRDRF